MGVNGPSVDCLAPESAYSLGKGTEAGRRLKNGTGKLAPGKCNASGGMSIGAWMIGGNPYYHDWGGPSPA
jgi:hypothetical protein